MASRILKAGHTATRIPTQVGDVLILETRQSFTVYAVAEVSQDGQQECGAHMKVTHARNREAAVAQARAAVLAGRRIFVRDLDTGNWFEISACSHSSRKAGSSAQGGG